MRSAEISKPVLLVVVFTLATTLVLVTDASDSFTCENKEDALVKISIFVKSKDSTGAAHDEWNPFQVQIRNCIFRNILSISGEVLVGPFRDMPFINVSIVNSSFSSELSIMRLQSSGLGGGGIFIGEQSSFVRRVQFFRLNISGGAGIVLHNIVPASNYVTKLVAGLSAPKVSLDMNEVVFGGGTEFAIRNWTAGSTQQEVFRFMKLMLIESSAKIVLESIHCSRGDSMALSEISALPGTSIIIKDVSFPDSQGAIPALQIKDATNMWADVRIRGFFAPTNKISWGAATLAAIPVVSVDGQEWTAETPSCVVRSIHGAEVLSIYIAGHRWPHTVGTDFTLKHSTVTNSLDMHSMLVNTSAGCRAQVGNVTAFQLTVNDWYVLGSSSIASFSNITIGSLSRYDKKTTAYISMGVLQGAMIFRNSTFLSAAQRLLYIVGIAIHPTSRIIFADTLFDDRNTYYAPIEWYASNNVNKMGSRFVLIRSVMLCATVQFRCIKLDVGEEGSVILKHVVISTPSKSGITTNLMGSTSRFCFEVANTTIRGYEALPKGIDQVIVQKNLPDRIPNIDTFENISIAIPRSRAQHIQVLTFRGLSGVYHNITSLPWDIMAPLRLKITYVRYDLLSAAAWRRMVTLDPITGAYQFFPQPEKSSVLVQLQGASFPRGTDLIITDSLSTVPSTSLGNIVQLYYAIELPQKIIAYNSDRCTLNIYGSRLDENHVVILDNVTLGYHTGLQRLFLTSGTFLNNANIYMNELDCIATGSAILLSAKAGSGNNNSVCVQNSRIRAWFHHTVNKVPTILSLASTFNRTQITFRNVTLEAKVPFEARLDVSNALLSQPGSLNDESLIELSDVTFTHPSDPYHGTVKRTDGITFLNGSSSIFVKSTRIANSSHPEYISFLGTGSNNLYSRTDDTATASNFVDEAVFEGDPWNKEALTASAYDAKFNAHESASRCTEEAFNRVKPDRAALDAQRATFLQTLVPLEERIADETLQQALPWCQDAAAEAEALLHLVPDIDDDDDDDVLDPPAQPTKSRSPSDSFSASPRRTATLTPASTASVLPNASNFATTDVASSTPAAIVPTTAATEVPTTESATTMSNIPSETSAEPMSTSPSSPTPEPLETESPQTPAPPPPPPPARETPTVSAVDVTIGDIVGNKDTAVAVASTGSASAALTAAVAPASASSMVKVGAALSAIDCVLTEDDMKPPVLENPLAPAVGSSRTRYFAGGAAGSAALVAAPFSAAILFRRFLAKKAPQRRPRSVELAILKLCGIVSVVTIAYLGPSVFTTAAVVLLHANDAIGVVVTVISLGVVVGISVFVWLLLNRWMGAEVAASPADGNGRDSDSDSDDDDNSSDSTTTSSSSSTPLQPTTDSSSTTTSSSSSDEAPIGNLKLDFVNSRGAANTLFVETWFGLFDGARSLDSSWIRNYIVVEIGTSYLLATMAGVRPQTRDKCSSVAGSMAVVSLAHVIYIFKVHPYRTKLDTFFVSMFSLNSLVLGIASILAADGDDTARTAAGYAALLQLGALIIQTPIQCGWAFVTYSRRQAREAIMEADDDGLLGAATLDIRSGDGDDTEMSTVKGGNNSNTLSVPLLQGEQAQHDNPLIESRGGAADGQV